MVKPGHIELGPFFYHRPLPDGEGTESAVLWPFFQRLHTEKVNEVALRPFFNYRISETEGTRGKVKEIQALWPLFLHRESEGMAASTTRLYPILYLRRFEPPDREPKVDTFVLPLILTGRSGEQGRYFGLFPVGGLLKGLFARDEIRFLLFPLYADARMGEHRTWHVLWPIFEYGKGGGRRSLRVFPLFSWKQKDDRYEKLYILWPFFSRVQEGLGRERPTDSWYFLPFYGRQQTPHGYIRYYLYPFFAYQRSENPRNRFRAWQAPWPFLSFMRGDNYHKNHFWPIWGRYRFKEDYRKDFALYPFYSFYSYRSDVSVHTRRFVLPFYWDDRVSDLEGNLLGKRDKVWPFLDLSWSRETGACRLRLLSPLWFRDPDGFERNYGDFYALYRRQIHGDGVLDQKVLWYRWYRRVQEEREGNGGLGAQSAPDVPAVSLPGRLPESPLDEWAGKESLPGHLLRQFRQIGVWPEDGASPP